MLQGAKAIAELLKKNSTLRTLELNNNLIDYSGFSGLAKALLENKSLQSLYLNGNYGGALGASALAKGLEGNKALRVIQPWRKSRGNQPTSGAVGNCSKGKLIGDLVLIGNLESGVRWNERHAVDGVPLFPFYDRSRVCKHN
ncbi:hypothetical protein L2E82_04274 [Cichorium intybus]|uniref:Uncharacterized protein n=1 Tax=Cichorium intybus TaxID=13427 RepID=A0ACB9H5A3_CICIN|nr:hypothetical protein L2E82_04274 [Cichorium intybus]